MRDWEPAQWYRVLQSDGSIFCESSDFDEVAVFAAGVGRPVERMYREVPRTEWRTIDG